MSEEKIKCKVTARALINYADSLQTKVKALRDAIFIYDKELSDALTQVEQQQKQIEGLRELLELSESNQKHCKRCGEYLVQAEQALSEDKE